MGADSSEVRRSVFAPEITYHAEACSLLPPPEAEATAYDAAGLAQAHGCHGPGRLGVSVGGLLTRALSVWTDTHTHVMTFAHVGPAPSSASALCLNPAALLHLSCDFGVVWS
uniref:Uncharacterized protein n=1 Tax=Knipowitschia caucasica TaxID=637954 RepID=A0AAV2KXW9_KNICA